MFSTAEDLMLTVADLLASISDSGLKLAKFLLIAVYWVMFEDGNFG